MLFADLDPADLYESRQRFDPAGHYSRRGLQAQFYSMRLFYMTRVTYRWPQEYREP